jgi:hypothetical protein
VSAMCPSGLPLGAPGSLYGLIWNIKAKNFLASFSLAFVHGPPQ